GVIRDVTHARQREVQHEHDATELRLLQKRLLQTEKMESMGRLARGVAHDFNNLLTIIQSGLDLVERAQPPEDGSRAQKALKTARDATERAARLTRQLLSLAKEQVLRMQRDDINTIIRELQDILQRVAGEQVALKLDLDSEPCWANIDPAQ